MTDRSLQHEASGWFLAHRSGEMTGDERAAFDAWMLHPAARSAYRDAERTWGIAADLGNDPEIAAIRGAIGRHRRGRRTAGRWTAAAIAASLAAIMVVVPDRVTRLIDVPLAPLRGGGQEFRTGDTRRTTAALADGTVVTLGAGTRLRVLEMGARRRVELLAGRAFFRVAKDPAHPFLVSAMDKSVHAIGTAFDVRIDRDAVAVTLVEGKVRVDESRGLLRAPIATDMTPGKQLIAANDAVWMLTPVDTRSATAWLQGRLAYTRGTVGQIVADMNAGSARKIVLLGSVDESQRLVGSFEPGDVDALATALEMKGIAKIVARTDDRIEMQ